MGYREIRLLGAILPAVLTCGLLAAAPVQADDKKRPGIAAKKRGPRGDYDRDGIRNRRDRDDDNDGRRDGKDRHPKAHSDTDRDGIPNHRDRDDDNDGIRDSRDRHPYRASNRSNRRYANDFDRDGIPDSRDRDDDNDGVIDSRDRDPRNPRVRSRVAGVRSIFRR